MSGERVKALLAAALLAIVFVTVLGVGEWHTATEEQEDMHNIARALFDTYVVAFLVLSVLLTGALFGALYLGMPSDEDEEAKS